MYVPCLDQMRFVLWYTDANSELRTQHIGGKDVVCMLKKTCVGGLQDAPCVRHIAFVGVSKCWYRVRVDPGLLMYQIISWITSVAFHSQLTMRWLL